MSIFKGAGVAIVTPMKNNEEVNYDRLEQMIEYQINQGTDCIIIAGTTGESSTLTTEEHAEVIKAAVKFAKHRIPGRCRNRFKLYKRGNPPFGRSGKSRRGWTALRNSIL